MEYTKLTRDQRKALLQERIVGLETEHYQHVTNLNMHNAMDDTEEVSNLKVQTEADILIIERAHAVAVAQLAELEEEDKPSDKSKPKK